MKRVLLILFSFLVFSVLCSCSDSDTEDALKIAPVSNITFVPGAGEITFKWENPKNADLSHVEILFKDANDVQRRVLVLGKLSTQCIYGLADNIEREFRFITYNNTGQFSDPVNILAKSGVTPFNVLLDSTSVRVDLTGVEIKWNNIYEGEFYIEIGFQDKLGMDKSVEIVVNEKGKGSQFIELPGVYKTDLHVKVVDVYGNKSINKVFNFKRLESGKFDRTIWRIVDFSSEEAGGEGPISGYASALLDGVPTTFWHSKWNNLPVGYVVKYPHYVTFDLGRIVKIERAEIYRRVDKTDLKTFEIQGGPSKNGPWKKIKEYVILSNNNAQAIPFDEPVEYQFIRLYCTVGNSAHASLAEFALFGQDLVEE